MTMTTESNRTVVGWALRSNAVQALRGAADRRGVLEKLAIVYFVAVFLFVGAYAWLRPDYNWDMVAYVATALEDRHQDPQALHAETWGEIGKGAREAQLYNLQYGNPYNRHQWENPADFQSQLSMYRVKVGYIALMRLMEPVTGLATASMLLSIVPLLGIGALALYWLGRERALQAAFVLAPALMVADIAHMATAATPDLLLALAIGALGKFASFPLPDDRFYFVFLAGMAMIVAVCWKPRFNPS